MATNPRTDSRPAAPRPSEPTRDSDDNLTLMLSARRRRHLRHSAWASR
jgi:hypothetical protein